MKAFVRSQLYQHGYWLGSAATSDEVLQFIRRLKPMTSSRGLVRVGPVGDGGYLVPDDLDGITASISPGVSQECGFDTEIADRGIVVHMADASVSAPPVDHPNFRFRPLFLDVFESPTTTTLEEEVTSAAPEGDLLLQMDIEGAEFRVLQSASSALLSRFRIMVIEFHDLSSLFTPFGLREISSLFEKILKTHHVVHIHPNNYRQPTGLGSVVVPQLLEFTFYRKDRATFIDKPLTFPHPMDSKNVPELSDVVLPECWYKP
jgi:hypothetical protein